MASDTSQHLTRLGYMTQVTKKEMEKNEYQRNQFFSILLPGLFHKKLPNEVLGQFTCLAEEFLIKVITHSCDICQCFLLRVSQEGRCST